MLRISTTALECYRRMIQTEYTTEDELVGLVTRKPFRRTWQMQAGSDWHQMLEKGCAEPNSSLGLLYATGSNGFSFSRSSVAWARGVIGPGVWEVKHTKILDLGGESVELVAKADHCCGLGITDNKTKFSQSDSRDYEGSLQWRAYLLVHEARRFTYRLWSFRDPDNSNYCQLNGTQAFDFQPYDGMEADVCLWLGEFVLWSRGKGLESHLEKKPEAEAVPF